MTKRAFLFGANYETESAGAPRSVEADLNRMHESLTRAGFVTRADSNFTLGGFQDRFTNWVEGIGADDTVLIYFTGHGVVRDGELLLQLYGTDRRGEPNAISVDHILRMLHVDRRDRCGTQLIILDCCHAGLVADDPRYVEGRIEPRTVRQWILACGADELAVGGKGNSPSPFTTALTGTLDEECTSKKPTLSAQMWFERTRERFRAMHLDVHPTFASRPGRTDPVRVLGAPRADTLPDSEFHAPSGGRTRASMAVAALLVPVLVIAGVLWNSDEPSEGGSDISGVDEQTSGVPDCEGAGLKSSWVQVESYTERSTDWVVPGVVTSEQFCDATTLAESEHPKLFMRQPLSESVVASLSAEPPPAELHDICEVRRQLRIAGGRRAPTAPFTSTYFSDFVIVPDEDDVGPRRCWPLLKSDAEYGSRAALDWYVAILDEYVRDKRSREWALERLGNATTLDFQDKSGGVASVLDYWSAFSAVRVEWLGEPELSGDDHVIPVELGRRRDGAEARESVPMELVMRRAADGIWRLHWDIDWGTTP